MKLQMQMSNIVEENNMIYFWDRMNQTFCSMNSKTKKIDILLKAKGIPESFHALNVFNIFGKIFFTSQFSTEIIILNRESLEYEFIDFDKKRDYSQYSSVTYNEDIVFFPYELDNMLIIFQPKKKTYEEVEIDLPKLVLGKHQSNTVLFEDNVYIGVYGTNLIVKINLANLSVDVITLPDDIEISCLEIQNNGIVVTNLVKNEVLFLGDKSQKRVSLEPSEYEGRNFSRILTYNDRTILLPSKTDSIYVINEEQILKRIVFDNYKEYCLHGSLMWFASIHDDSLFCWPWGYRKLVILDLKTYELSQIDTEVSSLQAMKLLCQNDFFAESEEVNLNTLIEYLKDVN